VRVLVCRALSGCGLMSRDCRLAEQGLLRPLVNVLHVTSSLYAQAGMIVMAMVAVMVMMMMMMMMMMVMMMTMMMVSMQRCRHISNTTPRRPVDQQPAAVQSSRAAAR
jgi:hypothetical protein